MAQCNLTMPRCKPATSRCNLTKPRSHDVSLQHHDVTLQCHVVNPQRHDVKLQFDDVNLQWRDVKLQSDDVNLQWLNVTLQCLDVSRLLYPVRLLSPLMLINLGGYRHFFVPLQQNSTKAVPPLKACVGIVQGNIHQDILKKSVPL